MKDVDFKHWCSKIPQLTNEQRILAAVELKVLSDEKTISQDWLFDGICSSLVKHGLLNRLSILPLKHSKAFAYYRKHAIDVQNALLSTIAGLPQTRLSYAVLSHVAGQSLITWCKRRHETITPELVLNNILHCLDALNSSFPGYLQAGLLGKAIIAPASMFEEKQKPDTP